MLLEIFYIRLVLDAWSLELGASAVPAGLLEACSLVLGAWSLELGAWSLELVTLASWHECSLWPAAFSSFNLFGFQ